MYTHSLIATYTLHTHKQTNTSIHRRVNTTHRHINHTDIHTHTQICTHTYVLNQSNSTLSILHDKFYFQNFYVTNISLLKENFLFLRIIFLIHLLIKYLMTICWNKMIVGSGVHSDILVAGLSMIRLVIHFVFIMMKNLWPSTLLHNI